MTIPSAQPRPRRRQKREATAAARELPANVVALHPRVMPRHTALLARWLEAGRRMGLCDASAFQPERPRLAGESPRGDYVLIWVRENIDPAYMIVPEAGHWVVIDAVRQQTLARLPGFGAALHFIRPVLPLEAAA